MAYKLIFVPNAALIRRLRLIESLIRVDKTFLFWLSEFVVFDVVISNLLPMSFLLACTQCRRIRYFLEQVTGGLFHFSAKKIGVYWKVGA